MTQKPKSAYLAVRVTDRTRTKFHAKASRISTPSDVLRELIGAFIEDRVTIHPPVKRNLMEKIYVNRNEN